MVVDKEAQGELDRRGMVVKEAARTEIYTRKIVGSVRCV